MSRRVWVLLPLLLCVACSASITPSGGKVSASLDGRPSDWAIADGKYVVRNAGEGKNIKIPFKIYNNSNSTKKVIATPKVPNYLTDGYQVMDLSWVVINDDVVSVPPNSVIDVPVYISVKGKVSKMEVWVGFKDSDQKGMTKTEYCGKILVE